MKIKAGKYLTRDGREAIIFGEDHDPDFPIDGYVDGVYYCWMKDGRFHKGFYDHQLDLVAPKDTNDDSGKKTGWEVVGKTEAPPEPNWGGGVATVHLQRRGSFGLYGPVYVVPADIYEMSALAYYMVTNKTLPG